MSYVELDRRFSKWHGETARDDDFRLFEQHFFGEASWAELLKHQRVVILAAAGSGKSQELEERAKRLQAEGEFAFHASVRNIGNEGLAGAFDAAGKKRLENWLASEATAWFFIDSVDEAKLDHVRFVDALRKLGDGLGYGLSRARIVLSGRYSHWEFRADLESLESVLPIATHAEAVEADTILSKILCNEFRRESKRAAPEKPLVVLMAPLDNERVRKFAEGQGVQDLDAFMSALEAENLWDLAKRPLDLSWLVDYWQKNLRFGRFAEMLEVSIRNRLVEPNPEHGKRDQIDAERAFAALERLGATMVLGRSVRIEIPDTKLAVGTSRAIKLQGVLPDWPPGDLSQLLTRPVFEPASLGQVCLHNDNEGIVRGFLAAKWLKQRLDANAPISRMFQLLFGDADGTPIVLPSVQETAAWLAIWVPEIATEVVRRDPSLLLTAGDPSSLSAETRQAALEATIAELAAGVKRHDRLDRDTLRRFATTDMVATIEGLWTKHQGNEDVRHLLLTMVELGRLKSVADLARSAANGAFDGPETIIFGIRALGVVGNAEDLQAIAKKVESGVNTLDEDILWTAAEVLFPKHLCIDELLNLIEALGRKDDNRGHLGWRGKGLIDRVTNVHDLKKLLGGLLPLADTIACKEEKNEEATSENELLPLIQVAASNLLKRLPIRKLDPLLVDAAVRLADPYRSRRFEDDKFQQTLHASPERRRLGLWRAVDILKGRQGELTNLWQLDHLGWSAGLKSEDIHWLLDDARNLDSLLERRLALRALMGLWREIGESEEVLSQIREAAELSKDTATLVEDWLKPPEPSTAEIEHSRTIDKLKRERADKKEKRDRSWTEFIEMLKSNPEQLRTPPPSLKPGEVDRRLYDLYQLLRASTMANTSYAVEDFGPLADVLGPDVTRETTDAMINFWRVHTPTLASSLASDKRNLTYEFDCMGIVGISLEANENSNWADDLTEDEAKTAAALATLELNGFPQWLPQLVRTWPKEAASIFSHEAEDHILNVSDQHGFLDKVAHADPEIAALVAPSLMDLIERYPDLESAPLSKAIGAIVRALPQITTPTAFIKLLLEKFACAGDPAVSALCLGLVFRVDSNAGVAALLEKLSGLGFSDQKRLAEHVLPAVFGDRWFRGGVDPSVLPFEVLERVVGIAFRTIRHEEDAVHEGAYSPDTRDHAEDARRTLFKQLVETPGRATLEALKRLMDDPSCPLPKRRIAELCFERASTDAERAPWPPGEAEALEGEFDVAPRTPRDLQLVALNRIHDIDHDLHHHQFAQGQTFKALPNEREVQKWLAHELDHRKGRAFSVEREPHVVDEKEPDMRLQARKSSASLPIEVKVAESWTLTELEEAVTEQLAGRYLRERDQRHGVLIVTYQNARPQGWKDETGTFLIFGEVVERLRKLADGLGIGGQNAARVEIVTIDVSDVEIV